MEPTTEVPGFEQDIRPLFREHDRLEMDYYFDLWSYEEVKAEAGLVLERLEDGTMPCDQPWEEQQLQLFRDWIAGGCQP
jgi:hypothetical protein